MIRKFRPSFLLRSFANRVISKNNITAIIYRLCGHRLLAFLLFLSVEKGKWLKDKPCVLCVKRNLFSKDILELRKRVKNCNWLTIGSPQLVCIQSVWVPKKLQIQRLFQKYFTEDYQNIWKESKLFAESFLKLAYSRLNVKAVLSANIDYWQDEGLRRACKVLSIPFLVLSRENCTIPKITYEVKKDYQNNNFKFGGDGVAVFSQNMKNVFVESGACKSKDVFITGLPRLDAWRNIKLDKYHQNTIVLLPYGNEYGLKTNKSFYDVLNTFLYLAKQYHNFNIRFFIKCKNIKYKLELKKKLSKEDLKYINVTAKQPLFELFPLSRLIIGYNTLALVEALFSRAVIAIPQWGEIGKDSESQQFNPRDKNCSSIIEFVKNRDDMEKLFEKVINNPPSEVDMKKRISLLKKYFYYNPDKTNSEYVEDFVLSYIK